MTTSMMTEFVDIVAAALAEGGGTAYPILRSREGGAN